MNMNMNMNMNANSYRFNIIDHFMLNLFFNTLITPLSILLGATNLALIL